MNTEPYLRLDLTKVADSEPRRQNHESGRLEHRMIFEACLKRDAKAAERYSVSHLRRVMGGLRRYLRRHGR
jgi:DNA-binding GntR family transcriptional regulator